MKPLQELIQNSQQEVDLADSVQQEDLYGLVEQIRKSGLPITEINLQAREAPLQFKLAAKLHESKQYLEKLDRQLNIAVVFAMWGEHNRLLPRSATNPNGEDSLRVKLQQLDWAAQGTSLHWTVYAVDDGDPNNSGAIAAEIAAGHPLGTQANILHLSDAIPAGYGPLAKLNSVDESRKGGSIIYGCMQALSDDADVIIYTDADNSVHLGQIGLLLHAFAEKGYRVVLGNRKHADSVLVKQEGRWGIGIKLLRHMQRMLGQPIYSLGIHDTQAAFKLYERSVLEKIISEPTTYDFSFDTDWILAVIAMREAFTEIPFAFIDSAAESASITQGPMTTWEALIQGLKTSVRKYNLPHNTEMAGIIDEEIRSARDLEVLIDHLPDQLIDANDADLGNPDIMSPAAVAQWIRKRKLEEGLV